MLVLFNHIKNKTTFLTMLNIPDVVGLHFFFNFVSLLHYAEVLCLVANVAMYDSEAVPYHM